ncbi:MAG: T9SS type A sorting domain-containing protein [Bacteroidia bacterium]|nr:T9SS type A sorting domain-containing protein [Bacteroidia bacterium]
MKSILFTLTALVMGLSLRAQVQTPVIVQEDTFSSIYTGGLWLDTQDGYSMITRKNGYGITYVRLDSALTVSSEYYPYRSSSVDDAFRTSDGGIIISGHKVNLDNTRVLSIIKLDSAGKYLWQSYSNFVSTINFGRGAAQVAADTFVAIGRNYKLGYYSAITLSKFDKQGGMVWDREYIRTDGTTYGIDIETTSDGNYLSMAQFFPSDTVGPSVWLLRTNTSGDSLSSSYLGGRYDMAHSLLKTTDSNFLVVTTENWQLPANWFKHAIRVHKVTPTGDVLWSQRYMYLDDDSSCLSLRAVRARATSDGGCVIVGDISGTAADTAGGHLYLLKIAPDGTKQWEMTLGTPDSEEAADVYQIPGGGYLVSATSWAYPAQGTPIPYMYVARLSTDNTTAISQPALTFPVSVRPNPFDTRLEVEISLTQPGTIQADLYDMQGRRVRSLIEPGRSGAQILSLDTAQLPAGTYVLHVSADGKTWRGAVVRR